MSLKKLICALIIALSILPSQVFVFAAEVSLAVPASAEMRGLWVTTAYNLDWPSRRDLSNAEIKREVHTILDRSVAQGINAIFLQVRPTADAFHRSDIFPWSHLLTGTQGQAPADGFDPLEYWIEQSHARGMEVHAWLNPYRITFPNQRITDPNQLSANHPARLRPYLTIAYGTSLFFDPGNPAARQLIIDGVEELLLNYDLDGIHLDDYFYPSRNFPDQATFARYGNGMELHDWRRENVNALVRGLQEIVRETSPDARFGISPTAIWKNDTTHELGSATRGMESFHAAYADTRRWVTEGWVDYIVPQIYWFTGFEIACYEVVLSWWEDVVRGTDVSLYVGLAIYREVQGRDNWEGEIVRQLERNARSDVVQGSILFRARFMDSEVGAQVAAFYEQNVPEQVTALPVTVPSDEAIIATPEVRMDRLMVVQPRNNTITTTDISNYYFFGSGVPGVPIYVNGQPVTNRTEEGFFSVFLPVARGQNTFTFRQEGQPDVVRNITNNAPAAAQPPATMAADIINIFPAADEWARVGTTLTLAATAPAGATVTAQIGGQTIQLTQVNPALTSTANNRVQARFTGSFTLNTDAPADAIIDIGRPVYTMTWNGITRSATAGGQIRQLGLEAPFFAEILGTPWMFPGATTTGGSHWMLQQGQQDRVAAISGNWTRLASGGWVESANVRTFRDTNLVPPNALGFMSEGRYVVGQFEDAIVWQVPFHPAVYAEFDGRELIVTLGMQNVAPPIFYNSNETIFSDIRIGTHNGAPAYFMTLCEGANLEGFYMQYSNGQLALILRRRRPLTPGNYPFEGFTFVVDAGHGGRDPGAVGPMGAAMTEAMLVLTHARMLRDRLEMLGAEVIMVRDTDVFYELIERVHVSRAAKPDMFISLHTNATAETTNATNIHGFTVWYRNPNSHPAARLFMNSMRYVNPITNRNNAPSQANFFVCRPVWSPSILLEASFTNNIQDFSWMINPQAQVDYAWGIVNALLRYYGA
ncbi:MAG: family 10 glycosylhydrolase [Defluviitaleaceae bacterium]|nr:family 10 glycosylhydrolase [Defluviitaleaceae bacterium]